jgi:hypothetical protein
MLLLRNMKEGLDHWTTGPLIPLTAFLLMIRTNTWDEQHETRSGPLDHWTTGPLMPLNGVTLFQNLFWLDFAPKVAKGCVLADPIAS